MKNSHRERITWSLIICGLIAGIAYLASRRSALPEKSKSPLRYAAPVEKVPVQHHYPPASTSHYQNASGAKNVYLVQEPETSPILGDAAILIYMHGMGGKEEQGMELFPALRSHLNKLGWIYVCPRENEYRHLLSALAVRYGKKKIYLSGASAGGRWAFWEAVKHPGRYSGLVLMCPAVRMSQILDAPDDSLPMPVWMVCGEDDRAYAAACRMLKGRLTKLGRPVHYREIPGGDHNAPCKKIRWPAALEFVTKTP